MKRLAVALVVIALSASCALAEVKVASPDGKRTATAKDKKITVTDNGTNKEVMSIQAHKADVTGLSYSPDGKSLASVDKDGVLNLFDGATGQLILSIKSGLSGELSFSKDGKTMTIKGEKNTKKFDVATGKEIK